MIIKDYIPKIICSYDILFNYSKEALLLFCGNKINNKDIENKQIANIFEINNSIIENKQTSSLFKIINSTIKQIKNILEINNSSFYNSTIKDELITNNIFEIFNSTIENKQITNNIL